MEKSFIGDGELGFEVIDFLIFDEALEEDGEGYYCPT